MKKKRKKTIYFSVWPVTPIDIVYKYSLFENVNSIIIIEVDNKMMKIYNILSIHVSCINIIIIFFFEHVLRFRWVYLYMNMTINKHNDCQKEKLENLLYYIRFNHLLIRIILFFQLEFSSFYHLLRILYFSTLEVLSIVNVISIRTRKKSQILIW